MSKFYVGQKVLVTGSTFIPCKATKLMVGTVGKIKRERDSEGRTAIWNSDKSNWGNFNDCDFQPINETPETLTVNGVEYIRKPEPEHEWRFGDVAIHKDRGIGIVVGEKRKDIIVFQDKETLNMRWASVNDLTFLRRTDFSV